MYRSLQIAPMARRNAFLLIAFALAACGGEPKPEAAQPAAPAPLQQQPATQAAEPTLPPAEPAPEQPPQQEPLPDPIGYPKPGWSKQTLDDEALPLCAFANPEERDVAHFLKDVRLQKLRAGSPVTFGAFGKGCINEHCDDLPSIQCNATLEGQTITVHAHYFGYHKDGATCTETCRRVTAGCDTPPLPAGKYKVVYGQKTFDLKIPSTLRSPCFVKK